MFWALGMSKSSGEVKRLIQEGAHKEAVCHSDSRGITVIGVYAMARGGYCE